jgi:hypothetical protein
MHEDQEPYSHAALPRSRPAHGSPRAASWAVPRHAVILLTAAAAAILMMGGLTAGADTQVYRSVDAQGRVVYSDRGSSSKAPTTPVRVHEPSAEDLQLLEKDRKASQAAEVQRLQDTLASRSSQAEQAQQRKDRQTRCDSARTHFYTLRDATRLYQADAQGNRVYLPDEVADAKRAEARKAMDAACGS